MKSVYHWQIDKVKEKNSVQLVLHAIKSWMILIVFVLTATIGSLYHVLPYVPLMWAYEPLFRHTPKIGMYLWFKFAANILMQAGAKIVITGDVDRFPTKCIILMNHRTRYDWMYYWCLVDHFSAHQHIKIVLKNSIKRLPGFGWATQFSTFVFLKRDLLKDKGYLLDMIHYFKKANTVLNLMLFPEGTNLHPFTVEKSNKFAEQNNLEKYEYSLHPRSTGFLFIVNALNSDPSTYQLDGIVDVTIGYKGNIPADESLILMGYLPDEVHFDVKYYKMSELPPSDEGKEAWLRDIWKSKESKLKYFYTHYKFESDRRQVHKKLSFLPACALYIYWALVVIISGGCLWYIPFWFCTYATLVTVLFYTIQIKYDGVERCIARGVL